MTKRTEALEQELIEAVIEEERQSSGEPERKIGRVILEGTDLFNEAFGWTDLGEYLERE